MCPGILKFIYAILSSHTDIPDVGNPRFRAICIKNEYVYVVHNSKLETVCWGKSLLVYLINPFISTHGPAVKFLIKIL